MDVLVNPPGEDIHPLRVDRVRDRISCANSNGISESRPEPIASGLQELHAAAIKDACSVR